MRKSYPYYTLAVFALLATSFGSCKKSVTTDNNVVIETPYTLYYADTAGALYNTNDGISVKKILFPPDGYPSTAICTSNNNILWIKKNIYLSSNQGTNFNASNYLALPIGTSYYFNAPAVNQTEILNAADEKRVYVVTSTSKTYVTIDNNSNITFHTRGLGIAYSEQDGNAATWYIDTVYDGNLDVSNGANSYATNVNVTTLTQLKNKTIVAYDPFHNRIFSKDNVTDPWIEHTHSTSSPDTLPMPNYFTLAHFNNMLVAIDYGGVNGGYYSSDLGVHWYKFQGLPSNRTLYYASSPFDQVLLVGTDSAGIYKLGTDNVTFASANIGFDNWTTVHSIAAKVNVYKNESITKQYIYLATSTGIYRSEDLGQSWIRMQIGNYVSVY